MSLRVTEGKSDADKGLNGYRKKIDFGIALLNVAEYDL
jgi:hypothetical protein